jgi:hypothetical protein
VSAPLGLATSLASSVPGVSATRADTLAVPSFYLPTHPAQTNQIFKQYDSAQQSMVGSVFYSHPSLPFPHPPIACRSLRAPPTIADSTCMFSLPLHISYIQFLLSPSLIRAHHL